MGIREIALGSRPLGRFRGLLGPGEVDHALALASRVRGQASRRAVWNVSSTARGGGVAEMLRPLLAYARGAGVDARWIVLEGEPAFFRITKRLHNALHGETGDRSPLGASERALYESTLASAAAELLRLVGPRDVVILHDPQTAGLAPPLVRAGLEVVWRCHIGRDAPNAQSESGWAFLEPYLAGVPLTVFSRRAYVPPMLAGRSVVVMPSIDPFSPKNQELDDATVRAIVCHVGCAQSATPMPVPTFERADGTRGEVTHFADVQGLGSPPACDVPIVLQVSRWDALKDPVGVMLGFAKLVEEGRDAGAHLLLAGPNVNAVADDPDGERVYAHALERWRALPHGIRRKVRLAMLPMHDVDENAAIVNALQRHATVVVQKSLEEGFGLTVTEAMWKARAVVASRVGGVQDQVVDGVTGLLVGDPNDLVTFGDHVARLLGDPALRTRLGTAAREHVRRHFLCLRSLVQYGELIAKLEAR